MKQKPTQPGRPFALRVFNVWPALGHLVLSILIPYWPSGRIRRWGVEWTLREVCMGTFNRRDFRTIRIAMSPDVEVLPPREQAALLPGWHEGEQPVLRGRDAVESYWREWLEGWAEFTIVPQEGFDLGGGRVLVLNRLRAVGSSSGIAIPHKEEADLWDTRDGRVVRIQQWWSWEEALEAAGVRDPTFEAR